MTETPELARLKENLTDAIRAVDAYLGQQDGEPRESNEVLVSYVVISAWRQFNDDDDADQLTHIFGPATLPTWQAIGLLEVGCVELKAEHMKPD